MITVNLYYTGKNGSARAFAAEMESTGIANEIRNEPGNLRYQYFSPLNDPGTVLLIDSWTDQAAIDSHHASPMMQKIMELREKYDLHMIAERFVSEVYRTIYAYKPDLELKKVKKELASLVQCRENAFLFNKRNHD